MVSSQLYCWRVQSTEELDSPAISALGVRSRKLSNALNGQSWEGWPKPYHLELLRASEGKLSLFPAAFASLAPTNPHWARVVGYGPFSLWFIHKEGLCPSSGDINTLTAGYALIAYYPPVPSTWSAVKVLIGWWWCTEYCTYSADVVKDMEDVLCEPW
jgi:hypothetical protein